MSDWISATLLGKLRRIARRAGLAAAVLAACLTAPSTLAMAEDSVITVFEQTAVKGGVQISFEIRGNPDTKLVYMRNPDRIALDFMETVPAVELPDMASDQLVTRLRHGLVAQDRYRLIFSLSGPAEASLERRAENGVSTLVLRLAPSDRASFDEAVARQSAPATSDSAAQPPEASASAEASDSNTRFTVVIDPGHGGIDTGAKGRAGTLEKAVNLEFSLALRDVLKAHGNVEVILTRETDEFIPLGERSAIARRAGADLFISVHADSIRYPSLRGATVYTLSEQASDTLSSEVADSENASDRFAGPRWRQEEPEVFDILVDLTRRETVSFSEQFASSLVEELESHDVRLIKNPKRSAGFRVLKAPDVPSVLVEMGYLSNHQDEKLLTSEKWRDATSEVIGSAIMEFLLTHPSTATAPGE